MNSARRALMYRRVMSSAIVLNYFSQVGIITILTEKDMEFSQVGIITILTEKDMEFSQVGIITILEEI